MSNTPAGPADADRPAFLLAQIGAHAAARFAERVAELDLTPAQAGVLRILRRRGPLTQSELAGVLGVVPSRVVVLVDRLATRGLVARRPSATDRRSNEITLTPAGTRALGELRRISEAHQAALLDGLDEADVEELARLLRAVAERQGLRPGVHPGYSHPRATDASTPSNGNPTDKEC